MDEAEPQQSMWAHQQWRGGYKDCWGMDGTWTAVEGWRAFQMFAKWGLKPDWECSWVSENFAESVYSADILESKGGGEVE